VWRQLMMGRRPALKPSPVRSEALRCPSALAAR
jgi:hypothetical protein